MENHMVREIKYKRLPKHEKHIISILNKLKILTTDTVNDIIFYGIDNRNLLILNGHILSVHIGFLNETCRILIPDVLTLENFNMKMYGELSDTVKSSVCKLFKMNILDREIKKVDTFGKTMQ